MLLLSRPRSKEVWGTPSAGGELARWYNPHTFKMVVSTGFIWLRVQHVDLRNQKKKETAKKNDVK
jgi:hypothetical protein